MGLEIGWHLRFAQVGEVKALVTPTGLGQVRNHIGPDSGWTMTEEPQDGAILLTFRPEEGQS